MGKTIHLVLALACAIFFTTNLSAQEVDKTEMPKAAKKVKAKGKRAFKGSKLFGAAKLTAEQKTQLASLVSEKEESLNSIREELSGLISEKEAKTIKASSRTAMKEGMAKDEAEKAALSASNLSEEQQAKVVSLRKQLREIEKGIADQVMATFSEEQKAAMNSGKGAKGKKRKEKGSKKKKGKKSKKKLEDLTP